MARAHGKILVDIWLDEDWCALPVDAQWTYMMILSQPKLSMVGCIDYEPHRWAILAGALDETGVETAIGTLEAAGFVCVDRQTRELLVRSMTRYDGLRTGNPKLLKGFWGQWKAIASPGLRHVAVDNMPDGFFAHPETPKAAEENRRSGRMDWTIDTNVDSESIKQSFRPPPSAIHRPTSAAAQSIPKSNAQSVTPKYLDPVDPDSTKHTPQQKQDNLDGLDKLRAERGWRKP